MDYKKWHSMFRNSAGKVSAMEIGFLLWMISLCVSWVTMNLATHSLADIPSSIVHLTLALGATKVTHRLAENNWEKIITQIIHYFKNRKKTAENKRLTKKKKGVK